MANCAGRVLHGSHCNALLAHYPLQERSPRVPLSLPLSLPPFPISALPSLHSPFLHALSSCPPTPLLLFTHTQHRVNRAPPALSEQMGAAKDSRLVFLSLSLSYTVCTHTFSFLSHSPLGRRVDSQQRSNFARFCLLRRMGGIRKKKEKRKTSQKFLLR